MSWPTRHGTNAGTAWCRHPGPSKGQVSARFVVPDKQRAEYLVIAEDGRVAVPIQKAVHLLAPDLRPLETVATPGYVRDVIATPRGFLAAAGGVTGLAGESVREELSKPFFRWGPQGLRRLDDGTLLLWDGSDFVRVDPATGAERARFKTDSTMSSTRAVAVGPGGQVWSAMAMSWQSHDDPPEATEYYGCLAAFGLGGDRLREWSREDGLPTSTGLSVRLAAIGDAAMLWESFAALFHPPGARPLWAEAVTRLSMPDGAPHFFGAGNGHRLTRVRATNDPMFTLLHTFPEDEWIKDLVSDGAGHVYAGTDKAIVGFRDDGTQLFRVEPFPVRALALGEGYLLALSDAGDGAIVRIH